MRRYIRDAEDDDIAVMRIPISTYMVFISGDKIDKMAELCGILLAVSNMCAFYLEEALKVDHSIPMGPLRGLHMILSKLTPPTGEAHRARVLEIYDEMTRLPE